MDKIHYMLDLETLGKKPGCVILSIGVTRFDPITGTLGESFYREINQRSCDDIGLIIDPSTVEWWGKQDGAALELLERTMTGGDNISTVLWDLADFITDNPNTPLCDSFERERNTFLWANSPSFDCDIIGYVFDDAGIPRPWSFYNEQDCRTLVELGRTLGIDPKKDMPFTGTPHNALDDAIHQAKYISAIYQHVHHLSALSFDRRPNTPGEQLC